MRASASSGRGRPLAELRHLVAGQAVALERGDERARRVRLLARLAEVAGDRRRGRLPLGELCLRGLCPLVRGCELGGRRRGLLGLRRDAPLELRDAHLGVVCRGRPLSLLRELVAHGREIALQRADERACRIGLLARLGEVAVDGRGHRLALLQRLLGGLHALVRLCQLGRGGNCHLGLRSDAAVQLGDARLGRLAGGRARARGRQLALQLPGARSASSRCFLGGRALGRSRPGRRPPARQLGRAFARRRELVRARAGRRLALLRPAFSSPRGAQPLSADAATCARASCRLARSPSGAPLQLLAGGCAAPRARRELLSARAAALQRRDLLLRASPRRRRSRSSLLARLLELLAQLARARRAPHRDARSRAASIALERGHAPSSSLARPAACSPSARRRAARRAAARAARRRPAPPAAASSAPRRSISCFSSLSRRSANSRSTTSSSRARSSSSSIS